MTFPNCDPNPKFPCKKVVWVHLKDVGRAAAGVAALVGCSAFTKAELVQLDDPAREQELLEALKKELEKALASERSV